MFKNKTILITGGSSGIGEATALLFAQNGADVAVTYKSNKKGAEGVVKKIQELGCKAIAIRANLIKERQARKAVEKTVKEFGKIDILVNNAGRYIDGDEWNGTAKIWIKSLEQNLVSVMSVSKYVIGVFQKQKSGVMINVSSRYSFEGQYDSLSYAAAKAGVVNITQGYAKLLAQFGGRANAVSPSAVRAGYWLTAPKEELEKKENKLINPESVAQKIVFLASEDARNINGQNFPITE
jgi:3-oxoacyl-[acyl-carrier protein] reductase